MRQRRVTGIEERLAPYSDLILKAVNCASAPCAPGPYRSAGTQIADRNANNSARRIVRFYSPQEYHLRWYQRPSELYEIPKGFDRVFAEFGCGRGKFINTLAEKDPSGLYIGIEGCKTIVLRAIQKTHTSGLNNLFYIDSFVNDAATAFEEKTLDGLFLNFSDPWPKERHAERRLTAPAKAASYKRVLKPGGFVILKTDSKALFDYSLKSFEDAGFHFVIADHENSINDHETATICEARLSLDLMDSCGADTSLYDRQFATHNVAALAISTTTEYEERFRAIGQPVYLFRALR
jgi:tRNA (guanine-N7-)-methyltransferase